VRVQQPWNKIASWRSAVKETYVYNQEKEVYAKLPHERSREYIYQLLEKVRFPIQEIDGLIEKRGNMVEFTCNTRRGAENLAEALSTRDEVAFARVRGPEYTDVKFHWVPSDFPDEKIKGVIFRMYGDIRYSRILKDRRGKADGRRIYNIKTEKLKLKPIPSTVKLSGKTFLVEYASQPIQCFLCKEFGHIKDDCPNYRPILYNAEAQQNQDANQETRENVLDKTANQGQTTQDKSSATEQPQAITDDKEVEMNEDGFIEVKSKRKNKKKTTVNQDDMIFKFPTIIHPDESDNINTTQKTKQQDTTARQKWSDISPPPPPISKATFDYVSTPTTENDQQQRERLVDLSLPSLSSSEEGSENEMETNTRKGKLTQKRLHPSPASSDSIEQCKKGRSNFYECVCGNNFEKPVNPGEYKTCACESIYVLCVCENLCEMNDTGNAVCNSCHRQMPVLGLDLTV